MKRTSLIITFAVVAASCWLACEDDITHGEISLRVSGTVTDSLSSVALESVAIAFDDTTSIDTYTDSTGFYTHVTGGRNSATVYAMKEGYRTKSKFAQDRPGGDTLDFQLAPE
jgi:hypothetical protein